MQSRCAHGSLAGSLGIPYLRWRGPQFFKITGILGMLLMGAIALPLNIWAASEGILFDFEGTSKGWEPSTKPGERGIIAVYPTAARAYHGRYSLALDTYLDYAKPHRRAGVAYVMVPGNLEGRPISMRVWCPEEAQGDSEHPNGLQIIVKDQQFRSQLSPWQNIGEDIPVEEWAEIRLPPSDTNPPDGHTDPGFDPTHIIIVGIKLGVGEGSEQAFRGTCYLDFVNLHRASLVVPASDHTFNFATLTARQQRAKPFGYGPYWDVDPGWGATAWAADDITVRNRALAIAAHFTLDDPFRSQTGFIVLPHLPTLDISHKRNRRIRAEVKFDPYVGPEHMLASIWIYDRRDSDPRSPGASRRWYRSRDIWVGGDIWNEITFDLNDPSQFIDTTACPTCLTFDDITPQSLKNIFKVGIQFFANTPYTGTISLDNITIGGKEIRNWPNRNTDFVTRSGTQFVLNGQPYRFAGTNIYYLFYKSHYMIDDVMATARRNGLRVLRTWCFSDGTAPYANDGDDIHNGNEGSAFQPRKGLYYEPTLVNFDYVVASAGRHGIRLICPLVNYWSDKDSSIEENNAFGGMAQYLEWCGIPLEYDGTGKLTNKDLFYTNACVKDLYKRYITHIITRVNTLTGIPYNEDPTILAWELCNECRCEDPKRCQGGKVVRDWAAEMSAYIKRRLDANHMVALGDEGFLRYPQSSDPYYNGHYGIDWQRNLRIATIDFGTVHLYPDAWSKTLPWSARWIKQHLTIGRQIAKPVVFEEFGICHDPGNNPHLLHPCANTFDRDHVYALWARLFEEEGAAGDLVWMIAGKVDVATEPPVLLDGDYYYPDYDGFTFWEPIRRTMGIIRNHARRMQTGLPTLTVHFEDACQGWGMQSFNQSPYPCQGVTPATAIADTGPVFIDTDTVIVDE